MKPSHRARLSLALSIACAACSAPQQPAVQPVPVARPDAAVVAHDAAPTLPEAPAERPASDRVQEALAALPVVPGADAAWFPSRILAVVVDSAHLLPSPGPPSFHDDAVVWTLMAQARAESERLMAVCDAVVRVEPRVTCATEMTEWNGARRARALFGWRASSGRPSPTLAYPLRALSRLGADVCLVSAQRTLRTLDLTVRVPDAAVLGRSLALMASVPLLSDLIMVRAEPHGDRLEAVLSWPLDRAESDRADLGDDAWPSRCDNASALAGDARHLTLPLAQMFITGTRSHGAIVTVNHRDWFATEGDTIAGATVMSVTATALTLRAPGRPRPLTVRYSHAGGP